MSAHYNFRTMKTILVYGATGDQGYPLMRRLLAAGYRVRAATRNPEAFRGTEFSEVDTVYANFDDPDSLVAAGAGADGIAMNLPFVFDVEYARLMGERIMQAAIQQGIRKVVFNTSCVVMDHDLGLAAHDGRRAIELAMEQSGLDYAVIRSTVYMDNLCRNWIKPSIVNNGIFAYVASAALKISWICLDDVAQCMVAALSNDLIKAEKILVGGPQALTGQEVAAIISDVMGREITFQSLDPLDFAQKMNKLVTGSEELSPHSVYAGMAKFYQWYNAQPNSPLVVDPTSVVESLGVSLTPFAEWAKGVDWKAPQ